MELFRDLYKLSPVKFNQTEMTDSLMSGQMGLEVYLEATHSALVNGNLRAYIPSRMADGTSTFINRRKPAKILKHHKTDEDPVGIVVGAEYISTIPDYLKADKNIQILSDSSFDIKKQVKAMKNLISDGVMNTPDWRGLGYIKLRAFITDPVAIQQIQTKTFDSVSTSFSSPGQAFCSICEQNLAKDGLCIHEAGEVYEDEDGNKSQCILIPGIHNYSECSLVNFDADPFSAIEIGDQENKKTYSFNKDMLSDYSETLYEFKDSQLMKEEIMADSTEVALTEDELKVISLIKTLRSNLSEEDSLTLAKKVLAEKKDGYFHKDQKEAELSDDKTIEYLLDKWDTEKDQINADLIYEEMEKELDSLEIKDAKLSTEQRKKLSKSTFCGPDKSFPVPDCSHVTAARRLIGRYKGPGDKTAILACVSRKAKAMGCNGDDCSLPVTDSQVNSTPTTKFEIPSCEDLKTISDTDAKFLFDTLEAELIARNLKLDRDCPKCAAKDSSLAEVTLEKDNLKTKVVEYEDQLKYLRAELRTQAVEYTTLADEVFNLQSSIYAAKLDKASLLTVLLGKTKTIKDAVEMVRAVDIDLELNKLNDAVDIIKIAEKFNDGMANIPTGTVVDPTIQVKSVQELLLDNLSAPAKAAIKNIKKYMSSGQIGKAKQLYDNMVDMKHINPNEISFDLFSVDKISE